MNLFELKDFFQSKKEGSIFSYGLSEPFAWRGAYAEVAFNVIKEETSREDILKCIDMAYSNEFIGYKGGEYYYKDSTNVNFEEDNGRYTDGGHCSQLIAEIEGTKPFVSNEARLVNIAFS